MCCELYLAVAMFVLHMVSVIHDLGTPFLYLYSVY
jgi:hypothetical protein